MPLSDVTIMLGSNAPAGSSLIAEALRCLDAFVTVNLTSPEEEFDDYSGGDKKFLNLVVEGTTHLPFSGLSARLAEIETLLGRDRSNASEVMIDIDVVTFGGTIVKKREYESIPYRRLSAGMKG